MVDVVGERRLDPIHVDEQLVIAGSDLRTRGEQVVELLELTDPDRGREVVEAVVVPVARVIEPAVGVRPALVPEAREQLPLFLGAGRHHPALAGRDLLVGVEREHGEMAVRADRRASVLGPQRLAGVLDQDERVALAELSQRVELAGVAEDVDGHDRLRPLCDRRFDRARIEVQRLRIDVGEDGSSALVDEAVRGGDERVGRGDHLVARADPCESRTEVQPAGTAGDGGCVRGAHALCEQRLEARDRGPKRKVPGTKHVEDELFLPLVDRRPRERDDPLRRFHASAGSAAGVTYSSQCAQRSLRPRAMSR